MPTKLPTPTRLQPPARPRSPSRALPQVEPIGHPLDPDSYSDEDRAPGWYVVPESPWKMRYWLGGEEGWSGRTTKTPKQTLDGWWKDKGR